MLKQKGKNEYFMARVVKRLAQILDLNKSKNLLRSLVPKIVEETKSLTDDFVDWRTLPMVLGF